MQGVSLGSHAGFISTPLAPVLPVVQNRMGFQYRLQLCNRRKTRRGAQNTQDACFS